MSHPNYLNEIGGVAEKLYQSSETFEAEIVRRWQEFEAAAASLQPPYDVLEYQRVTHYSDGFRSLMQEFVRFLYRNEDATWEQDVDQIEAKDAEYGGSWHARGGTGAFHALARKGDRIANQIKKHVTIAEARRKETAESIDDTIGDLRRYLILVLGWHEAKDLASRDDEAPQLTNC